MISRSTFFNFRYNISQLSRIRLINNCSCNRKFAMSIKNLLLRATKPELSIEVSENVPFQREIVDSIAPQFISVTWLSNTYINFPLKENPSLLLAKHLVECGFPVLLHLPGRFFTKEKILEVLNEAKNSNIKNILAIQGDWSNVTEKNDSKCDFPYSVDLVRFIKLNFRDDFSIGVAGYPRDHPHSKNSIDDLKYLKEKVSSGADFIITQAEFEYKILENFALKCKENNINVPIFPGIVLIKSHASLNNIIKYCAIKVPEEVLEFIKNHRMNNDKIKVYGQNAAAALVRQCLQKPDLFAGIHIYSMNDLENVKDFALKL